MATTPTHPRDLLLRMRRLQVAANRAEAARARTTALFEHYAADFEARRARDPHTTDTPLAETVAETQPVTGQSVGRIRCEVEQVLLLDAELPWLAEHLDAGRVDLARVRPVTDALREDLADHPQARARFGALMRRWFDRAQADSPELLNRTYTQVRNHVHYVVTKVLAAEVDDRFLRRHRQRGITTYDTGDGMAALVLDTDAVSVRLAERHLDLLARDARGAGDPRTLDQLRADLAVDLLTGRSASAGSGTTGRWARPVINLTVPVETLMGVCDEPGRLANTTIPASLVRHVAADPTSTWHRLLTDPARQAVGLSTTTYRPTGPIWRQVVATAPTCFAPTCEQPASDCDLDHRVPWPQGPTSTANLGPACRRHHRAKHAPGATLHRTEDGLRYRTRAGLTHIVSPAEQPVAESPDTATLWQALIEIQPNLADLYDALETIRQHRHSVHASHAQAELLGSRDDPGWWNVAPAEPEMSALALLNPPSRTSRATQSRGASSGRPRTVRAAGASDASSLSQLTDFRRLHGRTCRWNRGSTTTWFAAAVWRKPGNIEKARLLAAVERTTGGRWCRAGQQLAEGGVDTRRVRALRPAVTVEGCRLPVAGFRGSCCSRSC